MRRQAAGELLDRGLDHTDKALALETSQAQAARDLLRSADLGSGIRVAPQQGSMCIFWTRQDDGEIDRFSWHGGAPLLSSLPGKSDIFGWKWTLQKFKEVPLRASIWAHGLEFVLWFRI